MMKKDEIEFTEFLEVEKKLEVKVGEIISVEEIEGTDKLLKLVVDFGDETKVSVTNIKEKLNNMFGDFNLIKGKVSPFVVNLKPSKMRGVTSEVMIMPMTNSIGDFLFLESSHIGVNII